jgi:hypothetical protein
MVDILRTTHVGCGYGSGDLKAVTGLYHRPVGGSGYLRGEKYRAGIAMNMRAAVLLTAERKNKEPAYGNHKREHHKAHYFQSSFHVYTPVKELYQ